MIERRRRPLDGRVMETAINKIRGVYAVQVVITDDGVEEIHVIASPTRKPKQVVRDIESMLLVNFGIRVDYRRISLVQMQEERLFQVEGRPRLVAVRTFEGLTRRAEVELEKDGHLYTATARPTHDDMSGVELVSRATLEAMAQVLGEPFVYRIEETRTIAIDSIDALVVVVGIEFHNSHEKLLGISMVRSDPLEAAARATLNAVNRRLLIPKPDAAASA